MICVHIFNRKLFRNSKKNEQNSMGRDKCKLQSEVYSFIHQILRINIQMITVLDFFTFGFGRFY